MVLKKCYNNFIMQPALIKEKEILNIFRITIFFKGVNAFAEMLGGIVIWFTSKVFLVTFLLNFFQNSLSDDPKDYVANFIVDSAAALAVSSQYILGAYLFLHGIIKIILLTGLFKKKLWAYPASIIIFSLLIVYEIYIYYFNQSFWTLAITLFDMLIVTLTAHEYRILRKKFIK